MRLTVRRISEVNTIPDIRERSDRPKDKQQKNQAASTVQRQMVQKFVKELNDNAKQSDYPDSAETTATEQVETTAREIVHEAIQISRPMLRQSDTREFADPSTETQPPHTPESPRERTDTARTRPDATPQSAPTPAPQEQARRAYVQQATKEIVSAPPITSEQPRLQHTTVTAPSVENMSRQRTEDIRTRPEQQQPQSKPIPAPQEQARRAYVQQTAKIVATTPRISPEQAQPQTPMVTAPSAENTPRQRSDAPRTRPKPEPPQSVSTPTP